MRVSRNPHPVHLPLACLRLSREETAGRLTDVEGTGLDGDAGHREAGRGDDRPGSGAKHSNFDKGGRPETHKQRLSLRGFFRVSPLAPSLMDRGSYTFTPRVALSSLHAATGER